MTPFLSRFWPKNWPSPKAFWSTRFHSFGCLSWVPALPSDFLRISGSQEFPLVRGFAGGTHFFFPPTLRPKKDTILNE